MSAIRANGSRSLALALALLCSACATERTTAIRPQPPVDPKTQMAALEQRIFLLVEEERMRLDPRAKPLALDSELKGIAEERSADMARRNYMAHESPDGASASSLLMDEDAQFQGLLGENLAAQPFPAAGIDVNAYARSIVNGWLASRAHRENLAYAAYDRSAVAARIGGDTIYVIQLFATDLGLPPHLAPAQRLMPRARTQR